MTPTTQLGQYGGWRAQAELWSYVEEHLVTIHPQDDGEGLRMRALMERYQDTPMDLGDASLVVAAEDLKQRKVFTLDKDFYVYRLANNQPFEVVPGPA